MKASKIDTKNFKQKKWKKLSNKEDKTSFTIKELLTKRKDFMNL